MPVSHVECCDCMEFMARYPDKHFELAIIDPPYGIGIDNNFGKSGGETKGQKTGFCVAARTKFHYSNWDNKSPEELYFKELIRASKNQIIFGANHFISKIPIDSPCWIVWDKNTNGFFADCELAWTSFNSAVRKFEFTWNGLLQGDMKNKEHRIHPTQKPVAIYKWLLKNYAKPGDKILDTHLGSGSSRIAAWDMGFDFYGCELDAEYFEASCKRFERFKAQLKLDLTV